MAVFVYQSKRHKRTENPPILKTHYPYKKILRKEFKGRCVYCRLPDISKGYDSFGVDHYNPNLKPKINTSIIYEEYNNLFYCCNQCNSWKSNFWPTNQGESQGIYIPNPCDHVMSDHLQYKNAEVESKSTTGSFTIRTLDLNHSDSIDYKQTLIQSSEIYSYYIKSLKNKSSKLRRKLKQKINKNKKDEIEKDINIIGTVIYDAIQYFNALNDN